MNAGHLGRTVGSTLVGLDGHRIDVEVLVSSGLVSWTVVGLPDAAVLEARDRVRAALLATGVSPPQARVTVNLSPASLPKVGTGLDLAVAVAVLAAAGEVPCDVAAVGHVGELGLDGCVRPVRGILSHVLGLARVGVRRVVVPVANAAEAALVPGMSVVGVRGLADVVAHHRGLPMAPAPAEAAPGARDDRTRAPAAVAPDPPDLADVVGQPLGRRVVEVAAAGGHHVLFEGPPGAGKTMLAARLPGLLPPLDDDDALVVTSIHSVCGTLPAVTGLVRRPPFESPHHTASVPAVVGGGSGVPRPGAISRAHAGVLLLDEAPEFPRGVLEALRQPLEEGAVTVHRARGVARLPARFLLVMTANPCPCGSAGDLCSCGSAQRLRYRRRLSGPVLDRVDIRVSLPPVLAVRWGSASDGERTADVAGRVGAARERAAARWAAAGYRLTSQVPGPVLRSSAFALAPSVARRLTEAVDRGLLSGRGHDRCLRVAWTLADLAGRGSPAGDEVDEALDLRTRGTS